MELKLDLALLESEFHAITKQLSNPQTLNPADFKKLASRQKQIGTILDKARLLKGVNRQLEELSSDMKDPDLAELVKEEIETLKLKKENLENTLLDEWIGKEEHDSRNVFLEVRAGVGGEEAALFALDLLRIYEKYSALLGFKFEVLDASYSGIGGLKESSAYIQGKDVYGILKWESGVHRIQRVPKTESSGRVHTSTATVAVLPEVADLEAIKIDPKDLRIDTFRAGGKGGQNVNKVETAVRITHAPSGVVVACQQERSQFQNREKALKMLYSKLAAFELEKKTQNITETRRSQIKGAERSEKIRTYNILQSRITDHRIGESFYNIDEIFEGKLAAITEALRKADRAKKVTQLG